jgi:hypothetical protein
MGNQIRALVTQKQAGSSRRFKVTEIKSDPGPMNLRDYDDLMHPVN